MADSHVDTILYGGDIITMDDQNPGSGRVEAIAITDDIIVEVGSKEQVFRRKGPKTEVIFLNQQTLMPGFIEPHQHAAMTSQINCMYTNIGAINYKTYTKIREEMLKKIKELEVKDNGKWALFFGWDPELISDLPTLSATFLDDNFSTKVPIGVVGQSGHVAWVNSYAFSIAGVTDGIDDPDGGTFVRDENGSLTGQLLEEPAILGVLSHAPTPEPKEIFESVEAQWKYYASVGITTVTDMAYMPSGMDQILKTIASSSDCPIRLGLYQLQHPSKTESSGAISQSTIPFAKRVSCCPRLGFATAKHFKHIIRDILAQRGRKEAPEEVSTAVEEDADEPIGNFSDKLWEVGIKFIADGSPHCGTAAVREPFLNTPLTETLGFPSAPSYGILNFTSEDYLASVRRLNQEGKQVAIHCHGERACEQILKVYEQVLADDPTNPNRHRMEHLGLMTVDQIAQAGKINVALSFFVDHLRFYGSVYKTDIFGEERVNRWTPLSEATKKGITWTIHQDHPTFPGDANPFANMKTAVTRTCRDDPSHVYGAEYRVSIDEALKSYTVNAAWQLHLDGQLGSITVGKKADLVVLTENPYQKDPFKLEEIKVVETFLEGHRNKLANLTAITGFKDKVLQRAA